ncbi:hypothetical protein [Flavobacterium sp.]|jgi:hypothetical protein|uniref:hypothetical protein n=1 Tax=Flavobacterium sp. TaxID=239 RepID=UPI0037BF85B6
MKNKFLRIGILCVLLTTLQISFNNDDNFKDSDSIVAISRDLSDFTRVIVNDDINVTLVKSTSQSVTIMVNENLESSINPNYVEEVPILFVDGVIVR